MSADIRIERNANGYEVTALDPKIKEENEQEDSKWKNPHVSYQFETAEQVTKFIEEIIDDALPGESYSQAFAREAKAAKEAQNG